MIFAFALVAVLIISTVVCLYQYRRGSMLTPAERHIRALRPLTQGRRHR